MLKLKLNEKNIHNHLTHTTSNKCTSYHFLHIIICYCPHPEGRIITGTSQPTANSADYYFSPDFLSWNLAIFPFFLLLIIRGYKSSGKCLSERQQPSQQAKARTYALHRIFFQRRRWSVHFFHFYWVIQLVAIFSEGRDYCQIFHLYSASVHRGHNREASWVHGSLNKNVKIDMDKF